MSLQAVLERELRCAARKPGTWGIRLLLPAMTMLMSAIGLWFVTFFGVTPIPGRDLYYALSWISFGGASLVAATVTADLVSEEKREGTLGLLFLTNLRGHHIAIGKFASAAIGAFYAVLSVIPVLSLPMLMGAAGLDDVARTSLALVITMFFGMSMGLLVSTLFTNPWKASGASMFVMLFFTAGLPLLAMILIEEYKRPDLAAPLWMLSPSGMFNMASASAKGLSSNYFWMSAAIFAGMGIFSLAGSSLILPALWKDRPSTSRTLRLRTLWRNWLYGAKEEARAIRTRLLGINAFMWLASRARYASTPYFLFTAVVIGIALWFPSRLQPPNPQEEVAVSFMCLSAAIWVICISLLFKFAGLSALRFAADRKSGALELILSTPITLREILRGQWLALARILWAGMISLVLLHTLLLHWIGLISMIENGPEMSLRNAVVVLMDFIFFGHAAVRFENQLIPLIVTVLLFLLGLTCISVAWMSMWCSLRVTNTIRAPWIAIIACTVPPWPLFATIMTTLNYHEMLPSSGEETFLTGAAIALSLVLTNLLFWGCWSRRLIYRKFREAATDRYRLEQDNWFFRALRWFGIERKKL